ncbi:MAG: GxxExxY protein [Opitutales bacterium]|nr:GxxExxY protein [Opitutales bacterium]
MNSEDKIAHLVITAAIEVHRTLGPGLLESAYEEALCFELNDAELDIERQKPLPIRYKGRKLGTDFRIDVLVDNRVIVELKSVEALSNLHAKQLLTYLRLSKLKLGFLLNFNCPLMKEGIKRIRND